jgi:hypothetical protein
MAELARDRKCTGEGALDPGRDADLAAFLRIEVAVRAFLEDLVTQIVEGDLELFKNGANDVAFGERQEQMLGIDLAAAEAAGQPAGGYPPRARSGAR